MNKLIGLALLVLLGASGCTVRVTRPGQRLPPPPPRVSKPAPPVAQRMTRGEAIQRAIDYAAARGYRSRVEHVNLTGNDVWKVKLEVSRSDAKGKLHIDFDAWSRAVVRAHENVKYRKHKDRRYAHAHAASAPGNPAHR